MGRISKWEVKFVMWSKKTLRMKRFLSFQKFIFIDFLCDLTSKIFEFRSKIPNKFSIGFIWAFCIHLSFFISSLKIFSDFVEAGISKILIFWASFMVVSPKSKSCLIDFFSFKRAYFVFEKVSHKVRFELFSRLDLLFGKWDSVVDSIIFRGCNAVLSVKEGKDQAISLKFWVLLSSVFWSEELVSIIVPFRFYAMTNW